MAQGSLNASPSRGTWFASRDLFEVRNHIANTYCRHDLQVASRDAGLDTWHRHRRLKKIGIGEMSYGADVAINGIEDSDIVLLMQPLAGAAEIGTSSQVVDSTPARASVVDSGHLRRMRWTSNCVQRVIEIPTAVLENQAMIMLGRPLSQRLHFAEAMPIDPSLAHCWHYASLLSLELAGGQGFDSAVIDNLESLFVLKLLESHPSNYSDQLRPQPCKIAPQHVRRVEQYMLAHADQPITLEKLVEVSGVSARALFDGFRKFRGTSPMAYLRSVRLQRAHEDLKNAGPGASVTEIACRWEFYQFGRFAAQYKTMFGELPSETLRRFH
ncbi:AraC family transcriptional regulator [Novosphingobium flavum]|uniref:AraC family transcriptional regulator n=1 Tax=Novosphingobium aerophilum TaxID=2839843 RepID=UPI00163AE810|nr:AraC family transcriptional regulator [Novosphingobium aerophilum]MBC2660179.1 AraC family transcriptional regulator [Novosphingobium aerophilum]